MRYYVVDAGLKTWSSLTGGITDPNALNIELDISVAFADVPIGGSVVTIWGIALEDISQSFDFVKQKIVVSGGYAPGLPLATQQSQKAGILCKGYVWQCYGNWVGTEMTLNFVINPGSGDPPPKAPVPHTPDPPPKNIVLDWKKGKPLKDALQTCLRNAFPGYPISINVSDKLVAPQDLPGYYHSIQDLGKFLREMSQTILNKSDYSGVGIVLSKNEFTVTDGTQSTEAITIDYTDLIGQPTWIAPYMIQIRSIMRADISVGKEIKLPPTMVTTTAAAESGITGKLTFEGTFFVDSVRHVGNYRQPDGASWVTIIVAVGGRGSARV